MVRSMISRDDTWHSRYGVLPGYGVSLQNGFQDTFTATVTGALEMGSLLGCEVQGGGLVFFVK